MTTTNQTESKVAATILQKPVEIRVGEEKYEVAPPTTATLILLSELISKLPAVKPDEQNMLYESLAIAQDCAAIGDIVAVLILGAKNIKSKKTIRKKRFFGFVQEKEEIEINHQAVLAKKLLHECSPKKLSEITVRILDTMQVGAFFGLTTSLIEVNLLRRTKEVETTASGQ